eukprot:g1959.t1
MMNPTLFWTIVFGWILAGVLCECADVAFATLGVVFVLPTRVGTHPKFKKDPLDKLMLFKAVIFFIMAAVAHVFPSKTTWIAASYALLFAVAYVKSPARKYPSAISQCEAKAVEGKNVMVTGCTSGIGIETVRALAAKGATVFMVARSQKKLERVRQQIVDSGIKGHRLKLLVCDLNDFDSVKRCAEAFYASDDRLSILINNAGVMALADRRGTAKEDIERQVGINHVGHFLLSRLMLPALRKVPGSRLVSLSSSAHRFCEPKFIDDEKLETRPYDAWTAYGNSKYANVLFAKRWNTLYGGKADGCNAYAVMPGGIFTGLQDEVPASIMFKWIVVAPFFFKSVDQGAATTLHCATRATVEQSGCYFDNCAPGKFSCVTKPEKEKVLWDRTEALVKKYLGA